MNYLLIWDIDGTLIKGNGIGRRMMDKAFEEMYGIKDAFRDINMLGMLDYNIMQEAYRLHNLDGCDMPAYFERYCQCLREEVDSLKSPLAIEGIKELLEVLKEKKVFYNALGTGNIECAARAKLSKDGLNVYFPIGGFSEGETLRWKVIEKAAILSHRHYGVDFNGESIYVIGDTPKDIECGKILGTHTIGIANQSYSAQQLYDCGAEHVIEDYTDVTGFLKIFG